MKAYEFITGAIIATAAHCALSWDDREIIAKLRRDAAAALPACTFMQHERDTCRAELARLTQSNARLNAVAAGISPQIRTRLEAAYDARQRSQSAPFTVVAPVTRVVRRATVTRPHTVRQSTLQPIHEPTRQRTGASSSVIYVPIDSPPPDRNDHVDNGGHNNPSGASPTSNGECEVGQARHNGVCMVCPEGLGHHRGVCVRCPQQSLGGHCGRWVPNCPPDLPRYAGSFGGDGSCFVGTWSEQ